MPVIRYIPQDPFDLVIQGDQMRAVAVKSMVGMVAAPIVLSLLLSGPIATSPVIAGEQNYLTTFLGADTCGGYVVPTVEVLQGLSDGSIVSANAKICTPTGAVVPFEIGRRLMTDFVQASNVFTLTGQTLDKTGAALANCQISVEEVARQYIGGMQEAVIGVSDGSGNYSVILPMNTAYQVEAYLAGSPDLVGITTNKVTPGTVNVYLRDPTGPDVATSGMSRGRVANT